MREEERSRLDKLDIKVNGIKEDVSNLTCEVDEIKNDTYELKTNVKIIKDNHIAHIEKDISLIKTNVNDNTKNISFLRGGFWVLAPTTLAIAGGVVAIIILIVNLIN